MIILSRIGAHESSNESEAESQAVLANVVFGAQD